MPPSIMSCAISCAWVSPVPSSNISPLPPQAGHSSGVSPGLVLSCHSYPVPSQLGHVIDCGWELKAASSASWLLPYSASCSSA